YVDPVPGAGVADVADGHVIVLAPEEGGGIERVVMPQHVSRCSLALSLRNDPVFYARRIAVASVRPPRDVAGGEHAGSARFEETVDQDAVVDAKAGRFRDSDARAHAHTDHHEVGLQARTILEQ